MLSKCQWVPFFSAWRNSIPHLYFICTSMWDAISSDCFSAAICCMEQNLMEHWWESSTAMPPPYASVILSQPNKIGGIFFRAARVCALEKNYLVKKITNTDSFLFPEWPFLFMPGQAKNLPAKVLCKKVLLFIFFFLRSSEHVQNKKAQGNRHCP